MYRLLILLVFAVHGFFTVTSFSEHGYLGFFPPFGQSNTTQLFSDLAIALSLVNIWVYLDLRARNRPVAWVLPLLGGTLLAGSFAPLCYFLLRDGLPATGSSS